jgi:two-component system, LuxR family, response regulator FixJ
MAKAIAHNIIYIVDDDPDICQAISNTLNLSGYKTEYFTNPKQCLKVLYYQTCDLLIVDYKMPNMNGIEFTEQVKQDFPWIPVIIITAFSNVPLAILAIKSGAVNYLEKPFDKDVFISMVNEVFNNTNNSRVYLTRMEKKVLELIHDGYNNENCSKFLNRSRRTIETHRANLMKKFNVNNVVDLIKKSSLIQQNVTPKNPKPSNNTKNSI